MGIDIERLQLLYCILYRSAQEQSNADGLCRLPVEEAPKEVFLPGDMVLTLGVLLNEDSSVTVTSIRACNVM